MTRHVSLSLEQGAGAAQTRARSVQRDLEDAVAAEPGAQSIGSDGPRTRARSGLMMSLGASASHQPTAGGEGGGMPVQKEAQNLGVPWEQSYGYSQAVRVGDTIWVAGQLSHDDDGNLVGPAPVDDEGHILDYGNMRIQMAQSYANARKVLAKYGATLDNVVEEVLYVTDMDAAFAVASAVRTEAYGGRPVVASTILVTPRLAFPNQLIEIKLVAKT